MKFEKPGLTTAVGSVPFTNPEKAVEKVLRAFPDIPAWPQLPNRSFLENMYVQFSEGIPCIVVDADREKIYFDTERDLMAEMELFYAEVIERDLSRFGMSREYAEGFYTFLELAGREEVRSSIICAKGQIVGPISFGLTVTDQHKRAILYNDALMDGVVKSCALKAAWQVRELKKLSPRVMVWLDEPYLASFGSGYVSLSDEQVLSFIGETVENIHAEGGIAGIHCCGNTDWSILMKTDLDVINFDAYEYFRGMTLYPEALKGFLGRGGVLALGLIPTSDKIMSESVKSLTLKLKEKLDILGEKTKMTAREVWQNCLLTPSCGTGTLKEDLADRVLEVIGQIRPDFQGLPHLQ